MGDIFKLLHSEKGEPWDEKTVTVGIRVQIADQEVDCPVSQPCRSEKELAEAVEHVREDLERVVEQGKRVLGAISAAVDLGIQPGMSGREVWAVLAQIEDEDQFVRSFNKLTDDQRIEVAEHVLTECNVFSGKASTFSERYNSRTTLME
jgi:hypothetical protein